MGIDTVSKVFPFLPVRSLSNFDTAVKQIQTTCSHVKAQIGGEDLAPVIHYVLIFPLNK